LREPEPFRSPRNLCRVSGEIKGDANPSRPGTDRLVAEGYDRVADAYERLEGEREWPRLHWLDDLLGLLPPHSRLLDLGCGSGIPATRAIVDHGHTALGVDVSEEQINRARRNVPEAEFVLASALDLDLPPDSLDAVVSFYVIEHMPREDHATLLDSIYRWLRGGGWLLITCEVGDEPGVVGDWLGTPMFFSHFDAATNQRLVREAGFEIVKTRQETQTEGSRPIPYLWLLARKPSASHFANPSSARESFHQRNRTGQTPTGIAASERDPTLGAAGRR
jgi:ubiquinone/menaquinone biosynthesis C-methylase UbiE